MRLDEEDKPQNKHKDHRTIGPQGGVANDEHKQSKGSRGQGYNDDGDGGVQRGDCRDFEGEFHSKPRGR